MTKKVSIHDHINEISETIEIPDDVPIEAELSRLGYSIGNIDYMVLNDEYTYEIQEYSQDTRIFTVESNRKLPQNVIESVYWHEAGLNDSDVDIQHDITLYVLECLDSLNYNRADEHFNGLKVTTRFTGTDIGDDCQVNVEGDFYEKDI